jgi:hypothetical protein
MSGDSLLGIKRDRDQGLKFNETDWNVVTPFPRLGPYIQSILTCILFSPNWMESDSP